MLRAGISMGEGRGGRVERCYWREVRVSLSTYKWRNHLHRLYVLHHHDDVLHYQVTTPTPDLVEDRRTLEQYFRLDFDLMALYTE